LHILDFFAIEMQSIAANKGNYFPMPDSHEALQRVQLRSESRSRAFQVASPALSRMKAFR
jgi:hypothetical protein